MAIFRNTVFRKKTIFENVKSSLIQFINTEFEEVDFVSVTITSSICNKEKYYDVKYILNNQNEFISFISNKFKISRSILRIEEKSNEDKIGNFTEKSDTSSNNVNKDENNVIFIRKGKYHELLIYYKNAENRDDIYVLTRNIPIIYDYSKFAKKARFGLDSNPTDLSNISFKGVDLLNVEFHNVKWPWHKFGVWSRNIVGDEKIEKTDYRATARIYNQLKKF